MDDANQKAEEMEEAFDKISKGLESLSQSGKRMAQRAFNVGFYLGLALGTVGTIIMVFIFV